MRAVIRTYAGSKSSKIAKPDNKLTTSFSARRFSGAVIACGSALVLDLSRRIPQRYPGEQCASGGQKTHPGSSGCPWLPRGHNAVPQWERLHLFHRHVSHHCAAVNCSVGSFSGNSKPREPSLKSTHGPNLAQRCGPELKEVFSKLIWIRPAP